MDNLFVLSPSGDQPIEGRSEYQALKKLVFEGGLDPVQILGYLSIIYSNEADRLNSLFYTTHMPPAVAFEFQVAERRYRGIVGKLISARQLFFEASEGTIEANWPILPSSGDRYSLLPDNS